MIERTMEPERPRTFVEKSVRINKWGIYTIFQRKHIFKNIKMSLRKPKNVF